MAQGVSRRNGRTFTIRTAAVVLAAATCIFLGGLIALAGALANTASSPSPSQQAADQSPAHENESTRSTGTLLYPRESTPEPTTPSEEGAEQPTESDARQNSEPAENAAVPSAGEQNAGAYEQAEQQNDAGPQRVKTIQHTAFERVAVYKTVQHMAAVKGTQVIDGKETTVWTLCPACGKRHDTSYTQRVLSHYDNVYCKACGKKHVRAFTETASR